MRCRFICALMGILSIAPGSAVAALPPTSADTGTPVAVSKVFIVTSNAQSVTWTTCLSFTNETKSTMRAVRFGFVYKDAFGGAAATFHADRVGEFAPGVLIEGPDNASDYLTTGNSRKAQNCFSYPTVVGSISSVDVQILKVRYGDGTVWTNPAPATVFSGNFITNIGDGTHPARVMCGFLSEPWDFAVAHAPKCIQRYYEWKAKQDAAASASPSPSATP